MTTVKENDTITLSYIGRLDNSEVFKIVDTQEPVTVALGQSELPPTLENALIGMAVGETRKIRVPPEEGYGPRQKDLLQELDNEDLVKNLKPKPGMIIGLMVNKDGAEHKVPATVIEVHENSVLVDYNHPLAGHHLTYEVTILAIN